MSKRCICCDGTLWVICPACHGSGDTGRRCRLCRGEGHFKGSGFTECSGCGGSGIQDCPRCYRKGGFSCPRCDGTGLENGRKNSPSGKGNYPLLDREIARRKEKADKMAEEVIRIIDEADIKFAATHSTEQEEANALACLMTLAATIVAVAISSESTSSTGSPVKPPALPAIPRPQIQITLSHIIIGLVVITLLALAWGTPTRTTKGSAVAMHQNLATRSDGLQKIVVDGFNGFNRTDANLKDIATRSDAQRLVSRHNAGDAELRRIVDRLETYKGLRDLHLNATVPKEK